PPEQLGVIASPKMANEDLFALRRLLDLHGISQAAGRVPTRVPGDEDDFLIRADKNPNSLGAELMGFGGDARTVLQAARARRRPRALGAAGGRLGRARGDVHQFRGTGAALPDRDRAPRPGPGRMGDRRPRDGLARPDAVGDPRRAPVPPARRGGAGLRGPQL